MPERENPNVRGHRASAWVSDKAYRIFWMLLTL